MSAWEEENGKTWREAKEEYRKRESEKLRQTDRRRLRQSGFRNEKLPPEKERKAVWEWTGTERKGQVFFPAGSSLQDPHGCLSFLCVTLRLTCPLHRQPRQSRDSPAFLSFPPSGPLHASARRCSGGVCWGWMAAGGDRMRREGSRGCEHTLAIKHNSWPVSVLNLEIASVCWKKQGEHTVFHVSMAGRRTPFWIWRNIFRGFVVIFT